MLTCAHHLKRLDLIDLCLFKYGAVVVVGGTSREPQTSTKRAEQDDSIHATILRLRTLDAAFSLYGIHCAVENPRVQLGGRPVIPAKERNDRMRCHRVD